MKAVPDKKRKSTKPAKVLSESLRKRVKKGFEDKSKSDSPGKIYDTTEDTSPMTRQKGRAKKLKKTKRGEVV